MSKLVAFLSWLILALNAVSVYAGDEAVFTFPMGAATPSDVCGECHGAIYREYLLGVGSDAHSGRPALKSAPALDMPARVSSSGTAHAESGLTCVGCHLTKDGKIRTAHKVRSPHLIVFDSALQSSAVCAQCHGFDETGKRVVGKEMQTFLEWQQDYFQAGLGTQQCQDCHMPRTLRHTAEGFDEFRVPVRAVGRHLWTGASSRQRHLGSLSLTIVGEQQQGRRLSFHVSNIGAGHSVPTGMSRRAVYLRVEVLDEIGNRIAEKQWVFAPSKGDPVDEKLDALGRGNARGLHEPSIRAGEERVLEWAPPLAPGEYTVKARLAYTLDRFANNPAADRQSELAKETVPFSVR